MRDADEATSVDQEQVDVAIVTILSEEYNAVRDLLSNTRRDPGAAQPNTHGWLLGDVPSDQGTYKVVLALAANAGNVSGYSATYQTIKRWKPRYVLIVGVAGGLGREGLGLGDLAISKQIAAYEHGKLADGKIEVRPEKVEEPDGPLLRASVVMPTTWTSGLQPKPDGTLPKMRIGMIGSGEKVVDDRGSDFFKAVEAQFPKLIAVEMEGAGAGAAIKSAQEENLVVGFLMIRGISDTPPNPAKKSTRKDKALSAGAQSEQRESWKLYASKVAATFATKLIAHSLPVPPKGGSGENAGSTSLVPSPGPSSAPLTTESAPASLLLSEGLAISERFEQDFLRDPGMALVHPDRPSAALDEFFVCPDIQELNFVRTNKESVLSGTVLVDKITHGSHRVFVLGDNQVGKTSLAKWLFRSLKSAGKVPIYLSDLRKPLLGEKLASAVSAAFASQYSSKNGVLRLENIPSKLRVIIVDDAHLVSGKSEFRRRMNAELRALAGSVVVFANNLALPIEDLFGQSDDPNGGPIRYQILPLGHLRRAELIKRWNALGDDEEADDAAAVRLINDAVRLVDSILGRNFVPAHPPYIISLLQARKTSTAVDKGAGTHGYFYELLIRSALARDASSEEYDMIRSYLVYVATAMMAREVRTFSIAELREVHDKFEDHVDVGLEFDGLFRKLVERNVFVMRDGVVGFKYRYYFYYFAAVRLQDSLSTDETRRRLSLLAETLHSEESANILLFLVHLTKDPFVIELLLSAGKKVFPSEPEATLSPSDYKAADLVLLEAATEILLEGNPEEERQRVYAEMDASQRERELQTSNDGSQSPNAVLTRIMRAIAALQLIGQVAKNFPGTLEATTKVDLLNACYGIGRRLVGWYIQFVTENNLAVIAEVSREVQKDHPAFPVKELVERAQRIVAEFVTMTCFSVVKQVSTSVGSHHLERTYKKVLDESVPLIRLFDLSIKLDHTDQFPLTELKRLAADLKENPLALVVVRGLVMKHFHVFPLEYSIKQSACSSLGIKYERKDLETPATKLLPPQS